jgi:hypothetical protein
MYQIIIPVYKNKGCPTDPDNFRAITLISCLGKLFTFIVNTRLIFFANEVTLIHENQAGFRKGYSTIDNIFVLSCPSFWYNTCIKNNIKQFGINRY